MTIPTLLMFTLAQSQTAPATTTTTTTATSPVQQFFTWESFGTFAGASAIVMVLSNVITKLTGKAPAAWVCLILSLIVAISGAAMLGQVKHATDIFLAFLNGCLLFTSAAGLNETVGAIPASHQIGGTRAHGALETPATAKRLLPSWFR
jgi:hypothetical protein